MAKAAPCDGALSKRMKITFVNRSLTPPRRCPGYAPIMPSFRGQISEEQLMELIAYIKSLVILPI